MVLDVRELSAGDKLAGLSLQVGGGEIVGIAGLEGQGQRDLFYALAGELRAHGGSVSVAGGPGSIDFALVPEERKSEALFLQMRSDFNLTLPLTSKFSRASVVSRRRERRLGKTSPVR